MQYIVGFDLETSGSDLDKSIIFQVGLYDRKTRFTYARDTKSRLETLWPGDDFARLASRNHICVQAEALKVNGWTRDRYENATLVDEVDIALADRLRDHYQPKSLVAVGWNVAGFDILFLRRDMPKTSQFFHYRTVDLNACVFMLAGESYDFYHKFKNDIKAEARDRLLAAHSKGGVEDKLASAHDAGYDAMEATEVFYLLRNRYGIIESRK